MNITPISFATVNTSFQGERGSYKRERGDYSLHQALWNAYADSMVELNSVDRELRSLSELIRFSHDDDYIKKLEAQRDSLVEYRDEVKKDFEQCKEELFNYRKEHGID